MRVYTSSHKTAGNITTAKTLAYITSPSTAVCRLLRAEVVAPDEDINEQMDIGLQKITSLGTPTATTVTGTKHENGDAAAASTTKFDVTASEPTYGADNVDVVGRKGAPSLAGWVYAPSEKEELVIPPSTSWGLRLLTALGTGKKLTILLTWGEVG